MSLITSENRIVCFPSFVLTVFWYSTSYTVIIVFWMMLMEPVDALVRWWHCAWLKCVSGLRRLERNFVFLRCIHVSDLVLKYGSDINEGNWLQLLFYLIVLTGMVPSVIGMSFFSCVSGFRLKFSGIALWRKCLQLDSKNDLTTNGLILWFFVGKRFLSSTSHPNGLKSARIAQLLFFFDDINYFRRLVWGVFWSVLQKSMYFLAIWFCNIDW